MQFFNTTITYWAPSTPDKYGQASFAAPVTLLARVEDRNELFIDAAGKQNVSSKVIYLQTLLAVTGYIYVGTSASTDPLTVDTARQVRGVSNIPALTGTQKTIKVWL